MRKHFSLVLAILLILSTLSGLTLTSSATTDSIQVVPTSLTGLCISNGQKSAAKTSISEINGIPTVKIMPDRCVDRTAETEEKKYPCYDSEATVLIENSIKSYSIDASVYKYARICYYYEPSEGDTTQYTPYIQLELKKPDGANTFMTVNTDDHYVAGNWGYINFDLSGLSLKEGDSVIGRIRVYAFGGYLGVDKCYTSYSDNPTIKNLSSEQLVPEDAAVHFAAIDFSKEPLGTPTISSISFAEDELSIEKGASAVIPVVTVTGQNGPITAYDIALSGHSSENTKLVDGSILIGADEENSTVTLTATSVYDSTKTATLTINVTNPLPRTEFDSDNVVVRFGVVSDVHQNGYYAGKINNQPFQEWVHVIDVFQKMAGTDANGDPLLDAILVDGDMTDGVANGGSNVGSFSTYGVKALQNMREVGHFAKGLWGKDLGVTFTGEKKVVNETTTGPDGYSTATEVKGLGSGLADGVKLFYSLGNHDESSRGFANFNASKKYTPVWSADLFAAVVCGWHYNPDAPEALANIEGGTGAYTDGYELSYRDYIEDLIDYNTNASTTVTADSFAAEFGVTLESADALFDKFFGHLEADTLTNNPDIRDESNPDTVTTYGSGLRIGNAHMTIDPDESNDTTDDKLHFIAIELGQSTDSIAWAKAILDQSVEEDPTKPVFILTHYKVPDTMYASGTGKSALRDMLSLYPQAIIWGGHTHSFMHNNDAIDTSKGFASVETTTTRYASSSSYLTRKSSKGSGVGFTNSSGTHYANGAVNKPSHEISKLSNGIYVEVDKNNSVRLHRVDIYRSYSAEYAKDTSLYSNFQNFATASDNDEFPAVSEAVYIREPWDITDIAAGKYLADYNVTVNAEDSIAPSFPADYAITAEGGIGKVTTTVKMNATDTEDDGMVYMYVAELYKTSAPDTCVERRYYTNFFYDYPQTGEVYYNDYGVTNTTGIEIDETRTIDLEFTGLNPGTEYTVKFYPVDDFDVSGEAVTATAKTMDGTTSITLADGRKAVFLDTTGVYTSTPYEYEGEKCYAFGDIDSAIAEAPDVIFYISGDSPLASVLSTKKDIEIIGLADSPEDAVFSYSASVAFGGYKYHFKNVGFNKTRTGDDGLLITNNCNVILEDVKATANPLNVFTDNYGNKTTDGTLTIKGGTGPMNWICGIVFDGAPTTRNIVLNLEGGTYNGVLINQKGQAGQSITGDFVINISGGDFNNSVRIGNNSTNCIEYIGNTILNITGGDFTDATVGVTGTTKVTGADITIIRESIIDTIKTFNKSDNGIYIITPDNEGGVGEATKTDGVITSFAVAQVEGKTSYVNGVAATSVSVEAGNEYVITYKTPAGIDFDINGGEGTTPDSITGSVGEDVTASLPDGTGFFRTYYDFIGWGTSPDATVAVEKAEITEEGQVFYAIWKAKTQYDITLNSNGGTCESASVKAFENETVTLPVASKDGAIFVGWAESADSKTGAITHTATKATTLYAIYAEVDEDVIYVDTTAETNGDGRSPFTPMNSFASALSAGSTSGTTYVFKTSTIVSLSALSGVGSSFSGAKGPIKLTATDPATGEVYDAYAVFSTNGHYSKVDVTFDMTIAAINHTGMHINACGHKYIFTENAVIAEKGVAISGFDETCSSKIWMRGGQDGTNFKTTYLEFNNFDTIGTYHSLTAKANVYGDANLVIGGGTQSKNIRIGNDGNSENYVGGNANVIINGYDAEAAFTTSFNITTIKGALNIVLNNGVSELVTVPTSYSGVTIDGGVYYVTSADGGKVTPVATTLDSSNAATLYPGQFLIETNAEKIYINGVETAKSDDNIYTLSGAENNVYEITYEGGTTGGGEDDVIKYNITLNANGGACDTESLTVESGETVALPIATKDGAIFVGWAESTDAKKGVIEYTATNTTTLYAIYATSEQTIVYVDPTYTGSTKDGGYFTPYTDYGTADKALTSGGIIVIKNDTAVVGAMTSTYMVTVTSLDPITGEDYAVTNGAVFSMENGYNDYRPVTYENLTVTFTGSSAHMNARGNLHVIGEGIKIAEDSPQKIKIRAGSYNGNHPSTNIVVKTPGVVTTLHAASGQSATIAGDANVMIDGGTVGGLNLGNDAGSGTVNGNINVVVDNYGGDTFTPSFYRATTVGGAVQFVFNNGSYDDIKTLTLDTSKGTIAKGVYVVKSTADGYVETTAIAGQFKITTELSTILVNGVAVEKAENNFYTLSGAEDGVYEITYSSETDAEEYTVNGTLITIRDSVDSPNEGNLASLTVTNGTDTYTSEIETAETVGSTVAFEVSLPAGEYTYTIEKNGYLTANGALTVSADGENSLGEIELVAGDIKGSLTDNVGDGIVDIYDFMRVIRGFSKTVDQDVKNATDIDEDGFMTVLDLVQVKVNFGKRINTQAE